MGAARPLGAGPLCVRRRYLRPNVITSVRVLLTFNAADAVLVLRGRRFLGEGLESWLSGSDTESVVD